MQFFFFLKTVMSYNYCIFYEHVKSLVGAKFANIKKIFLKTYCEVICNQNFTNDTSFQLSEHLLTCNIKYFTLYYV